MKRIWVLLLAMTMLLSLIPAMAEEAAGNATPGEPVEVPAGDAAEEEARTPNCPFVQERKIIGYDDRVSVNPREYPYCAIALFRASASCGCVWEATGFMVGPSGLVTAGDCLLCPTHGKQANALEMYFGYKSSDSYAYKYNGACTYWYSLDLSNGIDYGYIKLQERVGDKVGWFGMCAYSDADIQRSAFYGAGYRDGVLRMDHDWAKANGNLVAHTLDMVAGNCGCPIFDEGYYAIGIQIGESATQAVNYAARITGAMLREMDSVGLFD